MYMCVSIVWYLKCVPYVTQWWTEFLTQATLRPLDSSDFACQHGGLLQHEVPVSLLTVGVSEARIQFIYIYMCVYICVCVCVRVCVCVCVY